MKTIKAKVIMLPTNDKPTKGSILLRHLWKDTKLECRSVWQYDETKQLSDTVVVYTTLNGSFMDAPSSFKSQHIYLTTGEEIKEGDWYINSANKKDYINRSGNTRFDGLYTDCRKIVSTTDTSLWEHDDTVPYPKTRPALPQIPQDFLKEYCEADGKIDEVDIEITCLYGDNCPSKGAYDKQHLCNLGIKLDSSNCVIISKSKDSWSREEVEDLLHSFSTVLQVKGFGTKLERDWIEDNL